MNTPNSSNDKPNRRRSDLTLLGSSSQDLEDKNYTLEFGVNLSHITFEGLNTYSVTVSLYDKAINVTERLTTALEIHRQDEMNIINIEGGPPFFFKVSEKTFDLTSNEIEQPIVDAVEKGISWLKGDLKDNRVTKNRRKVPTALLLDRIAMTLLMSSISTIIGGSVECHNRVVRNRQHPFTSKDDYVEAMYNLLQKELEGFTVIAINRGVQYYVENS